MGSVSELAPVANRSTRWGGARDEREDEQEIFKAVSLGEDEQLRGENGGKERRGKERKGKKRWSREQNLSQTLN